jgi:hypothetical protein
MATVELDDADIVEVTPIRSLTLRRLETRLRDLGGAGSAWATAHRCASLLGKELRARAVLVHVSGGARDELRTIGVAGRGAGELLGAAFWLKDDAFARAVIESASPLRARFDGAKPPPARLAALAPSRSILAAGLRLGGLGVGIVEAIDPDDLFDAAGPPCVALVAERLASALGSEGRGGLP